MAIITINGWNRLAVSFRAVAGSYQPKPVGETSEATPKLKRTGS